MKQTLFHSITLLTISAVDSAQGVLQSYRQVGAHAIIIYDDLPEVWAVDLVYDLRAHHVTAPILVITDRSEDAHAIKQAGAICLLDKALAIKELSHVLNSLGFPLVCEKPALPGVDR